MNEKEKEYIKIYNDNYKYLYKYAYTLTKTESEAEDIVQETFLRAWKGYEGLKDRNKIKPWLKTILKREFFRKIESDKKNTTDEIESVEYLLESDVDLDLKSETNETLTTILMLDKEYRDILLMQAFYGYKVTEISEILNENENTLSTRLFRARKQLKILLNTKLKKERDLEKVEYF